MQKVFNLKKSLFLKWGLWGAAFSTTALLVFAIVLLLFSSAFKGNTIRDNMLQFFPVLTGMVGGALGGCVFGLLYHFLKPTEWKSHLTMGTGIIIYLCIFWMSLILGLSAIGQWD